MEKDDLKVFKVCVVNFQSRDYLVLAKNETSALNNWIKGIAIGNPNYDLTVDNEEELTSEELIKYQDVIEKLREKVKS